MMACGRMHSSKEGVINMAITTTTDPLNGLLAIRDGDPSARWNFVDAVGNPVDAVGNPVETPGAYGIGSGVDLTYSFPATKPSYYSGGTITGVVPFSPSQQQASLEVMAGISEIIGVRFSAASSGNGAITLAMNYQGNPKVYGSAYANYPGFGYSYWDTVISVDPPSGIVGDVWFNSEVDWTGEDFIPNGFGYGTLIHELGHALGLKHPFAATNDGFVLESSLDNSAYTVMSYTGHPHGYYRTVTKSAGGYYNWSYRDIEPETLMPFDIAALQYLYGANLTTRTGNDTYTFATDRPFIKTIWDGGGIDTISVANFSLGCVIDLRPGTFSSIRIPSDTLPGSFHEPDPVDLYDGTDNLAIAYGVTIERAIGGSGNDRLIGNPAANVLDGRGGKDTMIGGVGNDTYRVGSSSDQIIENLGEGTDTVKSSRSFTLGANLEKLILIGSGVINGTGNELNNTLTGNSAANRLYGLGGNDTLIGGGGADILDGGSGADRLSGGAGNDIYLVDNRFDRITENPGEGTDFVKSSRSFILGVNLEKLLLTGSGATNGTGNELNNTLTGNAGANTLSGLEGKDTLSGGGGADTLYGGSGNDRLTGGAGADIFVFDTALNGTNNLDTITDFSAVDDTIWLDDDIFTTLTAGSLAAAAFYGGANVSTALDASDRIIYNSTNGYLYYDADGLGSTASVVKIAILGVSTHPQEVTAADFMVVA